MTPQIIQPNGSPVAYPTITAGGQTYQLRFAHGAWFQLQMWGFMIGDPEKPIPLLALAAAAAGHVDSNGKWKTVGFTRPLDLADVMLPGETPDSYFPAVMEALGKVAPAAILALNPPPADEPASGAPN